MKIAFFILCVYVLISDTNHFPVHNKCHRTTDSLIQILKATIIYIFNYYDLVLWKCLNLADRVVSSLGRYTAQLLLHLTQCVNFNCSLS